jgi:hypothetical protein
MTHDEAETLRISREYAESCADCEELRNSEPYPKPNWQAAWGRRQRLMGEWMKAAKRLTERQTEPAS